MGNVNYIVNKDKRTVACVLSGCEDVAKHRVLKYLRTENCDMFCYDPLYIDNEFVGVAKCAPEDVFDEEYGKRLAFARARQKRDKAVNAVVHETMLHLVNTLNTLNAYGRVYVAPVDID